MLTIELEGCLGISMLCQRPTLCNNGPIAEDRPGLVVLTIELEGALLATQAAPTPAKLTSPYRAPLTKFLNKYATDSIAYFLDPTRMLVGLWILSELF